MSDYFSKVCGKKIAVIGIGISNTPLIRLLANSGADVWAFDKNPDSIVELEDEFKALNVKTVVGDNYLDKLEGFDIIFKSPGIRYDLPQLEKARKSKTNITSEMEIFFDLCQAKIIAVTGSDGKTTTTTLISEMLKNAGYKVHLGGNIGKPLLPEIFIIKPDDFVVIELSSFQLQTMKKSPNIAVITNISPNHLDMHKDYNEYIDAKKNIFLYQKETDILVCNADNEVTRSFGNEAKGEYRSFSYKNKVNNGCYVENGEIMFNSKPVMNCKDIRLLGRHNVENYMAAICAVSDFVDFEIIKKVATEFNGVEHRTEFVRELNGVKFYNSSIDSSPNRTAATLSMFDDKVILIAGGKDKNSDYSSLGEHLYNKVKTLILTGPTSEKIKASLLKYDKGNEVEIIEAESFEDAVKTAYEKAKEGDNVLLSPASTSFDRFKNFEQRGKLFKDLVNNLE